MAKIQSVEPNIADLINGWLKDYGLDYKLEQETLNAETDKALNEYDYKSGGSGRNSPDTKLLLQDTALDYYSVLIEYRGYKDKLVKVDTNGQVENKTSKNEPNYKNINSYAINGAVHYTSYTDIIVIGVTGFKNQTREIEHSIDVYYVLKDNFGVGQEVDAYMDCTIVNIVGTNLNKIIFEISKCADSGI